MALSPDRPWGRVLSSGTPGQESQEVLQDDIRDVHGGRHAVQLHLNLELRCRVAIDVVI
jgi:hypothetical protein